MINFGTCLILGLGWHHAALPLAETYAQPVLRSEVRPTNCRCPPDTVVVPEDVRATTIDLMFTPDGLQQAIDNRFTRNENGRCEYCTADNSNQHITCVLAVPTPILVFTIYNWNFANFEINVPKFSSTF